MSRKLDALVAELVMGWNRPNGGQVGWVRFPGDVGYLATANWSPSTDIADAWRVADAMISNGYSINTLTTQRDENTVEFYCPCGPCERHKNFRLDHGHGSGEVSGFSIEVAICIAALLAVGVPQDEIDAALK